MVQVGSRPQATTADDVSQRLVGTGFYEIPSVVSDMKLATRRRAADGSVARMQISSVADAGATIRRACFIFAQHLWHLFSLARFLL